MEEKKEGRKGGKGVIVMRGRYSDSKHILFIWC